MWLESHSTDSQRPGRTETVGLQRIREIAQPIASRTYRVKATVLEGQMQHGSARRNGVDSVDDPTRIAVPLSAVFTPQTSLTTARVLVNRTGTVRSVPVQLGEALTERIVVSESGLDIGRRWSPAPG